MTWSNEDLEAGSEAVTDTITPPPVPDTDAMLSGIIGEIARAGSEGKEVHPVAVATAALSWLSSEIGPDIYLPIGDAFHHANLFTLHIGRSARGGKGESMGLVRRIRTNITEPEGNPCGALHTAGLSSREGLAGAVHDGFKQGKDDIPAVDDKRLWIIESEFANVLAQGKREGNTLLPALRDIWDGGSIKPLTKGRGMWATDPHISLHGNITPGELQARIEAREINGGTFNRVLMIWAERTCLVPFPAQTDSNVVADFARRLDALIRWAKGDYPTNRNSRKASLNPAAARLWSEMYADLRRPHPAGELVAAATERRAPIAIRIALIHAILEQSLIITPDHIRVGYAWAQYGADTAAYVLAGMGGQARDTEREHRVLAFIGKQPNQEADRRALIAKCFKGHIEAKDLDRVLKPLVDDGMLGRREEEPKAGGRKRVIYSLQRANNANNANNEQRRGVSRANNGANNANNENHLGQSSQSSHDVRNAESLINTDCSQGSQSSQPAIEKCPQCHGKGCYLCEAIPDDHDLADEVRI